jgi:type IV pilus assembly protein PilQ
MYTLPAGPLAGFGAAGAGLTLLSAGARRVLALELSALEADGRGRIISSPRIVTADRVKALIEQGTELPYQAKVGEGVSGVQFRRAGLKLEVTPQITPHGHVLLELDITKDTVGAATQAGPAINTKHVRTQVQVENGGTVAIGGIYMQDQRTDTVAVPGLGSLPLVGALFRHQATSRTKSELIVFITPNVVAGPPLPARSLIDPDAGAAS